MKEETAEKRATLIATKFRGLCARGIGDDEIELLIIHIKNAIEEEAAAWREQVIQAREARDKAEEEVLRLRSLVTG